MRSSAAAAVGRLAVALKGASGRGDAPSARQQLRGELTLVERQRHRRGMPRCPSLRRSGGGVHELTIDPAANGVLSPDQPFANWDTVTRDRGPRSGATEGARSRRGPMAGRPAVARRKRRARVGHRGRRRVRRFDGGFRRESDVLGRHSGRVEADRATQRRCGRERDRRPATDRRGKDACDCSATTPRAARSCSNGLAGRFTSSHCRYADATRSSVRRRRAYGGLRPAVACRPAPTRVAGSPSSS